MKKCIALFIVSLLLLGCGGWLPKGKPSPPLKRFTLEYPPPVFEGWPQSEAALRVERFASASSINSRNMLYRAAPYRMAVYNFQIWIAEPADLVFDFLLRDLQASGLFQAIFAPQWPEEARFRLEGALTEFYENDETGRGAAVISLNAILLDMEQTEIDRKVVFQADYSFSEPIEKNAESLAEGMSAAMGRLSSQLISDIYAAVQRRCPGSRNPDSDSGKTGEVTIR